MPSVTIRNVSGEVHRAIRAQAALNGRSLEAELLDIIERAARPEHRIRFGSMMAGLSRRDGGLSDEELAVFEGGQQRGPAEAAVFE